MYENLKIFIFYFIVMSIHIELDCEHVFMKAVGINVHKCETLFALLSFLIYVYSKYMN